VKFQAHRAGARWRRSGCARRCRWTS
jgi:hypothetical protein